MELEVRNDRAAFGPLLVGFQVHYAIRHSEFSAEPPFVFLAEVSWEGVLNDPADCGLGIVW